MDADPSPIILVLFNGISNTCRRWSFFSIWTVEELLNPAMNSIIQST